MGSRFLNAMTLGASLALASAPESTDAMTTQTPIRRMTDETKHEVEDAFLLALADGENTPTLPKDSVKETEKKKEAPKEVVPGNLWERKDGAIPLGELVSIVIDHPTAGKARVDLALYPDGLILQAGDAKNRTQQAYQMSIDRLGGLNVKVTAAYKMTVERQDKVVVHQVRVDGNAAGFYGCAFLSTSDLKQVIENMYAGKPAEFPLYDASFRVLGTGSLKPK